MRPEYKVLGGLYPNGTIPQTADMNDYKDVGLYKIGSTQYPSNFPDTLKTLTPSCLVEVINGGEIVRQEIMTLMGGRAWRTYYVGNLTWSAWRIISSNTQA